MGGWRRRRFRVAGSCRSVTRRVRVPLHRATPNPKTISAPCATPGVVQGAPPAALSPASHLGQKLQSAMVGPTGPSPVAHKRRRSGDLVVSPEPPREGSFHRNNTRSEACCKGTSTLRPGPRFVESGACAALALVHPRSSRDRPDPVFVVELRRSWQRDEPDNLRSSKRSPDTDWTENDVLDINSYRDLVAVVSFLPVMNKRFHLAVGAKHSTGGPIPTILRQAWPSPIRRQKLSLDTNRDHYGKGISEARGRANEAVPLEPQLHGTGPSRHTKRQERRVAPWWVVQHNELSPTPLLDLTTAASLGKMPTTLVRRLISPLTRSSGFVDQILRQCASGNAQNARTSSRRRRASWRRRGTGG